MSEINWRYLSQLPGLSPVRFSQLKLIAEGYTYKEVSKTCNISEGAVQDNMYELFKITGAKNKAHLIHLAHQVEIL